MVIYINKFILSIGVKPMLIQKKSISILLQEPCPQKSVRKIWPISSRALPIRQQSSRQFSTPTSCQSAIFVRPLFAFVLCFLRQKIKQSHICDESVLICVIDQLLSNTGSCFNSTRGLTGCVDSRVAAQRLTGCCSTSFNHYSAVFVTLMVSHCFPRLNLDHSASS